MARHRHQSRLRRERGFPVLAFGDAKTGGDAFDLALSPADLGDDRRLDDALSRIAAAFPKVSVVIVTYGRAGGAIPPIDLWAQPDGIRLVHAWGNAAHETNEQWRTRASQVMRWIESGVLDVLIDRTYPLERAAQAHHDLESQDTVGKLLLLP